jgi:hypothetical protein
VAPPVSPPVAPTSECGPACYANFWSCPAQAPCCGNCYY